MKYHKVHMRRSQVENLLKYTIRLHWASAAKGPRFFLCGAFFLLPPRVPRTRSFLCISGVRLFHMWMRCGRSITALLCRPAPPHVCATLHLYTQYVEKKCAGWQGDLRKEFERLSVDLRVCVVWGSPLQRRNYIIFTLYQLEIFY